MIYIGLKDIFIPVIIRQTIFHQIFKGGGAGVEFLVSNSPLNILYPFISIRVKQHIRRSKNNMIIKLSNDRGQQSYKL